MKSLLFSVFIITVLFATTSCKKESAATSSDYYVKIKKGGTWVEYPVTAGELGPDLFNTSKTDLGVTASTTSGDEIFDINIQINGSNFATGTYISDNPAYYTLITFSRQSGAAYWYYENDNAPGMAASRYTINISSITPTTITGTFTGNYLYETTGETPPVTNITEGQFHVKRIR